ncbi:MAG TPA: asparagine synthase-related protein [Nitrososphaeraceae archaeon]
MLNNNIVNLLTLRYDPNIANSNVIRDITYQEIINHRQSSGPIPSAIEIENAIRKTIKKKIEELQPNRIAVAISAGVDSNVILSLIRKEFPNIEIDCLTVSFDDNNDNDGDNNSSSESEVKCAKKIAEGQNAKFHVIYLDNPLKDLPMLISIVKEPRWNIYQYYFIEKARALSSILFTGDGGDELFGGYTFRYRRFMQNLNNQDCSWIDRVRLYLLCHERDWVPDQEHMFGENIKFSWSPIYMTLKKYFDNNLDPLEQVFLADYHGKLMYDFIPTNEKYFKHFRLYGVAPLLSKDIIDLSTKIPFDLKYDLASNSGKIQLRQIIKNSMSSSMSNFIENKKMGFSIDLIKFWLKHAKEIVTSNLDKGRIFEDKIVNRNWYNKSLMRINETQDTRYISKMLQLLSLEIWYKLFITSEASPKSSL